MVVLTVDPGLAGCGCAWWSLSASRWSLLRAAFAPAAPLEAGAARGAVWMAAVDGVRRAAAAVPPPGVVAVEAMQVYGRGKGDPADLIALAAVGGGVLAAFPAARPVAVLPAEWKGQVPRDVMGERVAGKLRGERPLPAGVDAAWSAVAVPPRKTHLNDVLHAVGIGLYLFERGGLPEGVLA